MFRLIPFSEPHKQMDAPKSLHLKKGPFYQSRDIRLTSPVNKEGVPVPLIISHCPCSSIIRTGKNQAPKLQAKWAGGSHPSGRGVSVHEMWIFCAGPAVSFSWPGGLPGQQHAAAKIVVGFAPREGRLIFFWTHRPPLSAIKNPMCPCRSWPGSCICFSSSGLAVLPFVLGVSVMPMSRPAKVRLRMIRNPRFYSLVACLILSMNIQQLVRRHPVNSVFLTY